MFNRIQCHFLSKLTTVDRYRWGILSDSRDIYLLNQNVAYIVPKEEFWLNYDKVSEVLKKSNEKVIENISKAIAKNVYPATIISKTGELVNLRANDNDIWIKAELLNMFGDDYKLMASAPKSMVTVIVDDKVIGAILPTIKE